MGNHRGFLACAKLLGVGKVKHLEGPSVELLMDSMLSVREEEFN